MPVVANYRHRLVAENPHAQSGHTADNTLYWAGRTQLYIWTRNSEPLLPQLRRFLAEDRDRVSRKLRPDPYTVVWKETVGDYPAGSPYAFPSPWPETA